MKQFLQLVILIARSSPRLYAAPFIGAFRGAIHEVRRVFRAIEREEKKIWVLGV